jgi:hypothetical protein
MRREGDGGWHHGRWIGVDLGRPPCVYGAGPAAESLRSALIATGLQPDEARPLILLAEALRSAPAMVADVMRTAADALDAIERVKAPPSSSRQAAVQLHAVVFGYGLLPGEAAMVWDLANCIHEAPAVAAGALRKGADAIEADRGTGARRVTLHPANGM